MAWNAICDRCGKKRLNSDLRKEWTGLMVCRVGCFEARHPQDMVRARPDRQNPAWVRPEPEDVLVDISAGNPLLEGLLADGTYEYLGATIDGSGTLVFLEGTT